VVLFVDKMSGRDLIAFKFDFNLPMRACDERYLIGISTDVSD